MRTIYGNAFFLIGGYSPFVNRLDWLAEQIAQSQSIRLSDEQRRVASELLEIDQNEGKDWGQRVSKTFCLADFFVDLSKQNSEVKEGLQRC